MTTSELAAGMPSPPEIDWLADTMAARMLVDAASAARQDQRTAALRSWFPEAQYTEAQMLILGEAIAEKWRQLTVAIDARRAGRIAAGRSAPLKGCEGRGL